MHRESTIEISHAVTYLYFTQHVLNNALVLICLQDYCMHITSTHLHSTEEEKSQAKMHKCISDYFSSRFKLD